MKQKNQERLIALGLFVLLVITLIPLVLISKYNVLSADDYVYINIAQNGLYEGQGIFGVLLAQMKNAYDCWATWQGQYFANWAIMSFLAIAGPEKYCFVIAITLLPLLLAEFFLVYVILKKGFGATFSQVCIVSFPIMIWKICFPASASEAYYWLCGAVTYTTVYAISLFSIGLLIYMWIENPKKISKAISAILLVISAICLGGGNFVTGLFVAVTFLGFAGYGIWKKHGCRWVFVLNFLVFIICFLVTALSPGATNRRVENAEAQTGAVEAVLNSLIEAAKFIDKWTMWFTVVLMLVMIPLFLKIIKKKSFRFPMPLLVLIISFGLYAAHFTPNQFALGILGAYRVQNIYRFQMIFWLLGNEFYILGYLNRRFPNAKIKCWAKIQKIPFISLVYSLIAVSVIYVGAYEYVGFTFSPRSAYKDLRQGTAAIYYQEYLNRLELLNDSEIQDVVLAPYSRTAYLLFFTDFRGAEDWENVAAAEYYNKKSITVQK